jgi:hypothetical protein
METQTTQPMVASIPKKSRVKKMVTIGVLLVVLCAVVAFVLTKIYPEKYAKMRADREAATVINNVKDLIVLPEGTPAIFDVQDPELLVGQQAFFAGVEKGDKLLVYPESAKAIIYSPRRDIIVNVGPVTFDQNESSGVSDGQSQ